MSKKFLISKHIKKVFALVAICLIAITLTGCDSSNRKSAGNLDKNATYLTVGNYNVTVGEVYDSLRYEASSYLENAIQNILFAEEIETVKADLAKGDDSIYKERIENEILEEIYGSSEQEEIEELNSNESQTKVMTYINNMYQKGYIISADDIVNRNFSAVYSNYYLEVAKYVAAYNKLAKEFGDLVDGKVNFGDVTDDSYFTKKEVKNYFDSNYTNKGDVTSIIVRFMSSTEASKVLKLFGIKNYDGSWYQIVLPEDAEEVDTKKEYEEYYSDYSISTTGEKADTSIELAADGAATVLKLYVAIYNFIYSEFRDSITLTTMQSFEDFKGTCTEPDHLKYFAYAKSIIDADIDYVRTNSDQDSYDPKARYNQIVEDIKNYSSSEFTVLTNEKLTSYNSSLATYVYDTLETELGEDEETFTQYTPSAKNYGNYYYLIFKIAEVADPELYTEDDDDNISFEGHEELLKEVLQKMFDEELDNDYISEVAEKRMKDAKVTIFDSIIELAFMQTDSTLASNYEKSKKKDNNNIAAVKYQKKTTKISFNDFWNYIEPLYGPQQAYILLFNKYIKSTDYYKELEDNYDSYVEQIEFMLNYFTNGYYSSYGYDASMGKFNFMRALYHTANIDEIVKDNMMVSDAKNKFFYNCFKDMSEDKFIDKIYNYALASYNEFFSLTPTNISVYVDADEDGEADEDFDPSVRDLQEELIKLVYDEIKKQSSDLSTAVTTIINEYNSSSRISSTNPTEVESKWAKYRQHALYIKSESMDAITNDSVDVDDQIMEEINVIRERVEIMDEDLGFLSAYLDPEIIHTANGYSLLLFTAGSNATSSKFEDEELIGKIYTKTNVLVNEKLVTVEFTEGFDSNIFTKEQVKVYLLDYLQLGDVLSLPSTTTAALDEFLLPVVSRYVSSASQYVQMENIFKTLGSINFAYTAEANPSNCDAFNSQYSRSSYAEAYGTNLKNSLDSYLQSDYPNWWDNMYTSE